MRKNYLFIAALLFVFANCNAQEQNTLLSTQDVQVKIREVYADKTEEIVFQDQDRLKFLTDILEKRFKVAQIPFDGSNDKYPKLSQVALLNKYNPALQRDAVFNSETFNPLKYNFEFSSNATVVYRVDNTNYIIVITPQSFK